MSISFATAKCRNVHAEVKRTWELGSVANGERRNVNADQNLRQKARDPISTLPTFTSRFADASE